MKQLLLMPLLALSLGVAMPQANAQVFPCPTDAAKTANNFCIFLKWNGPAPSMAVLQNTTIIYTDALNNKDSMFTYLRGSGVGLSIDSAAVFKNATQGGTGSCNANPSSINLTSLAGQVLKFVYNNVTTTCFVAQPLPIVLSSFDTRLTGISTVQINWSTEVERDVNYFSVQRSTDGQDWKELARFKPTSAESDVTKYYQYTDNLAAGTAGQVYYRLVTIDYSGAVAFSQVNSVKVSDVKQSSSRVYPTITDGRINIRTSVTDAAIILTDLTGAKIPVAVAGTDGASEMDIRQLPAGMYILSISSRLSHESFKIIKQ